MTVSRATVALAAGLAGAWLATAAAHHSIVGQFDRNQRLTLSGIISKVDWINPHIYLHLDAKDATGEVTTWRLESVPPAYLYKAGVTQDMLTGGGETVDIEIMPARDRTSHLGFVIRIHYPDGHYYQLSEDYASDASASSGEPARGTP